MRVGLESVRTHDLHDSFASRALALGEGLPIIGWILGHRRITANATDWHRVVTHHSRACMQRSRAQ